MEEHFKNKLKNHKVDWDKEALLANLKEELHPNKKGFDWKWFLLIPVVLLATCWGWNNLQQPTNNAALTQLENNTVLNKKANDLANNTPKNQNEITNETDLINTTPKISDSKIISQNKKEANEIQSITKTEIVQNSVRPKRNVIPSLENKTSKFVDQAKSISAQTTVQSNNEKYKAKEQNTELLKSIVEIETSNVSKNKVVVKEEEVKKEEVKNSMVGLEAIFSLLAIEQTELKDLPIPKASDQTKKKDSVYLKNPFYISISGEAGLVYRNRTFVSDNSDFVIALEENEATEKSLVAMTTNINFGYQHKSGWSLQTGIEYQEINEVFKYNKLLNSETIERPSEIPSYFVVDNMDTTFVFDTVKVLRTEERNVRHFNKYKFFTIPLQVGYRFGLRKMKFITRLGASYTFSHNFIGKRNYIFSESHSEIIELNSNGELAFELKDRIGLQAGLTLEYPFRERSQIFAMATYRASPKLAFGIIEQRHHSFSLGLGYKFSFGGGY